MSQTRKVVEALMKHGPKYTTISRETGVPITTVRYILKEKLPKLGFTIRPAINYGKLGLQWYLIILDSPLPPDYLVNLLDLFGETMYLNYYAFLLNERKFLTIFSIPPKFESSFTTFLDELVKFGIIRKYRSEKLYYRRVVPLRADCFDFNNGVWLQNWEESPRIEEVPEIHEEPSQLNGMTLLDLKILVEFYKNPLNSYTDIAKKLNITRQTVKRHYENILSTIYLYMLFWMPIKYPELVCTPIFIQANMDYYMRKTMLNIPFMHLEMKSENQEYYAVLFVPSIGFYKFLRYISEKGDMLRKIDFLSMEYAANFVPPHNLFRDREGWLNVFDDSLQKILREIKLTSKSF